MNIRYENNTAIVSSGDQQATLYEWGELCEQLDDLNRPVVIDARSMSGNLTEIDAFLLALKVSEMRQLRNHPLAIVTCYDQKLDIAFFIASGKNLGLAMEAFDCIESATVWARCHGRQSPVGGTLPESQQSLQQPDDQKFPTT